MRPIVYRTRLLSRNLQAKILSGECELDFDASEHAKTVLHIKDRWEKRHQKRKDDLCEARPELKRILQFACSKGASNIITTLPLDKFGFCNQGQKGFQGLALPALPQAGAGSAARLCVWATLFLGPFPNLQAGGFHPHAP